MTTHCTHGYPAMHHLKVGDTCAICNTIVTVVASPATTGHRGGEGIGDALTSEIRTAPPAATSLPGCSPQTVPAATATATVPEAVAVAPIAAGKLDVNRVSGTDRGHPTAAHEGYPVSLFDSGIPAALFASAPTATSDGSVCPSALPAATVPILPQGAPGLTHHRPKARRTDPDPAHDAARAAAHGAHAARLAVLRAHADAGARGLTGDELAAAAGAPYEKVGPRRAELRDDGYVVKVLDGGRQVVRGGKGVWQITDAGLSALLAVAS